MTKKGLLGGVMNPYGIIRSSVDVQKQVLEQLGWNSEYLKNLKESLKAQGFTHPQIVDKIYEQRKEFITRQGKRLSKDFERNNPGLIDEKHRQIGGVFSYPYKLSIDL